MSFLNTSAFTTGGFFLHLPREVLGAGHSGAGFTPALLLPNQSFPPFLRFGESHDSEDDDAGGDEVGFAIKGIAEAADSAEDIGAEAEEGEEIQLFHIGKGLLDERIDDCSEDRISRFHVPPLRIVQVAVLRALAEKPESVQGIMRGPFLPH